MEEQAAILIGLARGDADDSFRLLRGRRDPIDLAAAIAARLELPSHDVARTMGQAGLGFDNAIATVVRLHPTADLLAVARAAWPQLNHAAITELIAPHRPDHAAESLGAQLIEQWSSVPTVRADQAGETLTGRWASVASEVGERMPR